jgi:hypothetical protein
MEEDIIEQKVQYASNPFKMEFSDDVIMVGNQEIVNQLSANGRVVFKYIPKYLNRIEHQTVLAVKSICIDEYKQMNATLATRIRRGIRNLVDLEVIAYTTRKDFYWVNKTIIWK